MGVHDAELLQFTAQAPLWPRAAVAALLGSFSAMARIESGPFRPVCLCAAGSFAAPAWRAMIRRRLRTLAARCASWGVGPPSFRRRELGVGTECGPPIAYSRAGAKAQPVRALRRVRSGAETLASGAF